MIWHRLLEVILWVFMIFLTVGFLGLAVIGFVAIWLVWKLR